MCRVNNEWKDGMVHLSSLCIWTTETLREFSDDRNYFIMLVSWPEWSWNRPMNEVTQRARATDGMLRGDKTEGVVAVQILKLPPFLRLATYCVARFRK